MPGLQAIMYACVALEDVNMWPLEIKDCLAVPLQRAGVCDGKTHAISKTGSSVGIRFPCVRLSGSLSCGLAVCLVGPEANPSGLVREFAKGSDAIPSGLVREFARGSGATPSGSVREVGKGSDAIPSGLVREFARGSVATV